MSQNPNQSPIQSNQIDKKWSENEIKQVCQKLVNQMNEQPKKTIKIQYATQILHVDQVLLQVAIIKLEKSNDVKLIGNFISFVENSSLIKQTSDQCQNYILGQLVQRGAKQTHFDEKGKMYGVGKNNQIIQPKFQETQQNLQKNQQQKETEQNQTKKQTQNVVNQNQKKSEGNN